MTPGALQRVTATFRTRTDAERAGKTVTALTRQTAGDFTVLRLFSARAWQLTVSVRETDFTGPHGASIREALGPSYRSETITEAP